MGSMPLLLLNDFAEFIFRRGRGGTETKQPTLWSSHYLHASQPLMQYTTKQ